MISRKVLTGTLLFILMSGLFLSHSLSQERRPEEAKKVLLINTEASCITAECHSLMGKKKYIHAIGVDPYKCGRCHEVITRGEHRFIPVPAESRLLCAQCHNEESRVPPDVTGSPPKVISDTGGLLMHAPFAEGKCTACHDAHESDHVYHLKASYPLQPYATYSDAVYRLCTSSECHKGYDDVLQSPRLLSGTLFRNGNLNLHFKHVNKKKGRTCVICHLHHGSRNPALITPNFQIGDRALTLEYARTGTGGSCITPCHKEGKYDRYTPVPSRILSTPTPGTDATQEELDASRALEMPEETHDTKTKKD